jgi:FixJ family two-component response regulator
MPGPALISVVDDDESVRESLPDLLVAFGFAAQPFASAEEFLRRGDLERTACLILDIHMPGMSGPELQAELARRNVDIPIIFITAHTDVAPGAGTAASCLVKPFSDVALLDALNKALGRT